MENAVEASDGRSSGTSVWTYVALTFAFSWAAWILAIKLHAREEFLSFGTAGPVFAAMILSRHRQTSSSSSVSRRVVTFCVLLVLCWIVLSLHYSWQASSDLRFALNPWLVGPAIFPAWIISAVFSKDAGVRCFLRRLVQPPNLWSIIAFLLFPAILIIPGFVAHLLHLPLVTPGRHGSMSTLVATGVVLFLYNVFFVAVLEEPGWRGFLLDRLQQSYSPMFASLAVWLPWALWHAPLDYFRPVRFSLVTYLQIRVIFLIPIAIILTWLYNRSGRSIQACAAFHASMNTFPFVLPYFAPGFGLLFIVAAYVFVADRMWRKRNDEPAFAVNSTEVPPEKSLGTVKVPPG